MESVLRKVMRILGRPVRCPVGTMWFCVSSALGVAMLLGSIVARADCVPKDDQVAFSVDANFQGACVVLAIGDYPTATSTGLPNDSVSSVRVGPGAQVRVCSDAYFAGTCVLLTANTPYVGNLPIGNDHLTSAKVRLRGTSDNPQDFDPRCSDRTATGKFDCTLHKPIVSRPEWAYQNVVFAPGDKVFVNGDGCVQTGGSGDTWKRYVNPGGGGADHLYHGLVRVPTGKLAGTDVGGNLTRIEHVVGRPITVTGDGMPLSQLVLHLGYEDDNYTDNGYDRHDDGTEDQCKGDHGNDGGPAHVTITICRQTTEPCTSMPSRFPFNVVSDHVDPNGFLFNPHWTWQDRQGNAGQIPSGSICHDFSMRNAGTNLGLYNVPSLPDCSDQAGQDTVDVPPDLSVNNVACTYGATNSPIHGTPAFGGHVNWFPVSVEGHAGPVTHESADDDYDFSFEVDGADQGSLYLNPGRPFLHTEFDSDETVDHFKSSAWAAFHQAVDDSADAQSALVACAGNPNNCSASAAAELARRAELTKKHAVALFSGHALATGMFGFDGEHGGKAELHPLYALATNVCTFDASTNDCKAERDPNDDVWLMFVRNRGDEGFCSSQIWAGGFDDYTFRLPWREGMTEVEVNWGRTEFEGSQGTSEKPEIRIVPPIFIHPSTTDVHVAGRPRPGLTDPPGVYVTFHLGYPTVISASDSSASIPFVDGALHLSWKGPGNVAVASHNGVVAASFRETESDPDVEDLLAGAIGHLASREQENVRQAGVARSASPVIHRMTRGQVTRSDRADAAASVLRASHAPRSATGSMGAAKLKLARDAARIQALCAATRGKPFGVSEAICKPPVVLDHR